ncbi:uncharacterized protein LOC130695960 [Daphnia carinata]|uniref:uncharacterized protein LOC130695960 n=1 Tax=Daphnia carinata TaxID=120202 RepID=UPI00257F1FCD|nr:uncharacterized protein LOC130695960 [Daphnia carinata]
MLKERVEAPQRFHRQTCVQLTEVHPKSNTSAMKKRWTEFIRVSTCAAVARLGDKSAPTFVKVIWKFTFIIGIVLTTVSTYFSTLSFVDMAGNSEMLLQSNTANWFEHPKYHICTSSTFNLTILAEMGFVDTEMVSYLTLSTSFFVVSPVLLQDEQRQRQLESKFNDILDRNNISDFNEIIQRALLKCEDIIAGCISPGIYANSVDCCSKFFPSGSFISTSGACVTTLHAPPLIQHIPSMTFGFVVLVRDVLDSRELDNSIVNPIMANQRGITFSASDKWTDPTVALLAEKHLSRFGLWTSLAVSKTIINDEEVARSILARKVCAIRDKLDGYLHLVPGFSKYTESNCKYAFRQKLVTQTVSCYLVNLPYAGDLPPCRPQQLLEFARMMKLWFLDPRENFRNQSSYNTLCKLDHFDECVSECWKEKYQFSASYADLHFGSHSLFGNWSISSNQSKHLAALNFYYPTSTQTLLVNHYPTINQWLGILGGNLGLFLGASMVTLVEAFVFCFSWCRWSRSNRQSISGDRQIKIAKKGKKSLEESQRFGRRKWIRFSFLLPIQKKI